MSSQPEKPNKSEFIRARGHLKPAQIVEEGKAAGLEFSANYVYTVRATSGAKDGTKPQNPVKSPSPVSDTEAQFRVLVRKLGTLRALEIVKDMDKE